MKKLIPDFRTDEEAEHFVETGDLTEYDLSGFKPIKFEFQAKAAQLNMRLPQTLLDAVKSAAKVRGIPYTRFVRETLEEVVAERSRTTSVTHQVYTIGNIEIAAQRDFVLVGGQPVHLPARQRALLELLILRNGMVITKETFLQHAYGTVHQPETKVVDFLLMKLRKALAEAGADHVIRTVWGRVYILQKNGSERGDAVRTTSTSIPSRRKGLRATS